MDLLTRETSMPRTSYARRIVADYRARIESGVLRPGERLPTQDQIAAAYGCSTGPVKFAINTLEALGYVVTHQGKGMFVADDPPLLSDHASDQ